MRNNPTKQVPPIIVAEGSLELSKSSIGPLVVMSGYLTKKARSRNRWLHRWFQLLDNGMLQYYQTDKKEKLLGEIDVGQTCYDIRQGTKNSGVSFPQVAPRCCCFFFSVLKRTYFMYAPTAIEAKKWFESIHGISNVLNRRVVAGVKRRKAPIAPGPARGSALSLNYRISMTPWDVNGKYKRSTSLQNVHRIRVQVPDDSSTFVSPISASDDQNQTHVNTFGRASSVPDFLDRVGISSPIYSPDPPVVSPPWMTPPPDVAPFTMPTNITSSPIVVVAGGSFGSTKSLSQLTTTFHVQDRTNSLFNKTTSPVHHITLRRRARSLSGSYKLSHHSEKKNQQSFVLPPRPASMSTFPKSCLSNHPQPKPRTSQIGAMQATPVNSVPLRPRNTSFLSLSKEALNDTTLQENRNSATSPAGGYRPIPKPRKSKEPIESDTTPKRSSRVTFVETPNVINATSPSDSENSVSLTIVRSDKKAVDIEDLPPPRPRKDSGPPKFIPPPPPNPHE